LLVPPLAPLHLDGRDRDPDDGGDTLAELDKLHDLAAPFPPLPPAPEDCDEPDTDEAEATAEAAE
jgi:hypothetical protein